MENQDKKPGDNKCGDSCHCGCCGGMGHMHGCHGGRYHIIRMILKIVLVVIIFWCGFRLGEMIGFIKANTGYGNDFRMMSGYNNYPDNVPISNSSNATQAQ